METKLRVRGCALSLPLPPLPSNTILHPIPPTLSSTLYLQHYPPSASGITPCFRLDNKLSFKHHTIDASKNLTRFSSFITALLNQLFCMDSSVENTISHDPEHPLHQHCNLLLPSVAEGSVSAKALSHLALSSTLCFLSSFL